MKQSTLYFCFCLIYSLSLFNCSKTIEGDLIITNINIIDVKTGNVNPNMDVVIDNEIIISIIKHKNNTNYKSENIVNGTDKYLIPGLWDMHVHIFNNNDPQPPNTWYFPLMIANGVTGVRDMFTKPNEQMDSIVKWRKELRTHSFIGPRIGAVGTLVDGVPRIHNSDSVVNQTEANAFVKKIKDAEINFVKVYDNLSKEAFDALNKEASDEGLYIAGHTPKAISPMYASNTGQKSIEHLTGIHIACSSKEDSLRSKSIDGMQLFDMAQEVSSSYNNLKADALFKVFVKNKTWQCPTLIISKVWYGGEPFSKFEQDEGIKYIPKTESDEWQSLRDFKQYAPADYQQSLTSLFKDQQKMVKRMAELKVPILAGTDIGNPYVYPGFSLLDEIIELNNAGLTNLEAIQTATLNPALYLNKIDSLGTVEFGKYADLVILESNPLIDIENIKSTWATIINGNLFDHTELDDLLNKAKEQVVKKN